MIFPTLNPGLKVSLKAGLSLAVLVYLFRRIEADQLWEALVGASFWLFFLALSLQLFNIVVGAFRWKLVTEALGLRFAFCSFVRYFFIGMFFNLFLPSPLGGDVARGCYLAKGRGSGPAVAASVFLDRFAGSISLLTISLVASILFFTRFTGIASGFLNFVLLLALLGLFLLGFSSFLWPTLPGKIGVLSGEVQESFLLFWRHPRKVGKVLGISLLCQSVGIVIHVLLGHAVGIEIPTAYYFVFVPLSFVLGALPISLNGLGIREGTYFYFLSLLQIPAGQALGFGLLWFLILVCAGLIGGVVYLLDGRGARTVEPVPFL